MAVFDIKTFDCKKNYAIDASAGTGKTYNIVQIVGKLLDEVKDLKLDQILIVTYTEKAAGELKDRIRAKIKGVDTDNAPISTFHSFCKNTIEEFPFAISKPANLTLVDEDKMLEFAKQYIRRGPIVQDIYYLIVYLNNNKGLYDDRQFNEESLIDTLTNSCIKYHLNSKGDEDNKIISLESYCSDEAFKYLSFQSIDDAISFNPDIKTNLDILKNCDDEKCKSLAGVLESNYNNFNYNGSFFKCSSKWPSEQKEKDAVMFFKELKDNLKSTFEKPYAMLTTKYLKDFYLKWSEERIKNNFQTFDDMINTIRESVLEDNSTLLVKLKEKYKYAIIDEFQDTNQKQFDIFSKVFLSDNDHHIIVVGDPKQSIYSFQGADVFVYKDAIELIKKGFKDTEGKTITGEQNSLEKNFRSTKDMVESCNKMFSLDDFAAYGFSFYPSKYLSIADGDNKEFSVLFKGKPVEAFWITKENDISDFNYAKLVAQQIIDCCKKDNGKDTNLQIKDKDSAKYRNVTFKDFTVLARVRSEMGPIEKALGKAGIPYIRYKDNGLFKDSECFHWIALLQAINENDFTGSRRKVLKKALFTDFFGLSLEEINKQKYNSDNIPEVELFRGWRFLLCQGKYESFIENILIESGLIERMTNLNDIQKLNKFRQIGDYCSDYLAKKHSLDDLINNLMFLSNGGSSEDDEDNAIVQKGTDFDCVQIMTIHASKGLQFPVVISTIGFKGYNNNVTNYIYHNDNNEQKLCFATNDKVKTERAQEMLRLLYVAYTRAQYIMLLPRCLLPEKGERSLQTMFKDITNNYIVFGNKYREIVDDGCSFSKLSKEATKLTTTKVNVDNQALKNEQDKINADLIKSKKGQQSYKHSYSNLSHPKEDSSDDEYDEDDTVLDLEGQEHEGLSAYDKSGLQIENIKYSDKTAPQYTLPKGSNVGSALHEIFEHTDFIHYDDSTINRLTEERFNANSVSISENTKKEVYGIVNNVLLAKFPVIHGNHSENDEFFSLNTIPNEDKKPEIEFNTNVLNGHLLNYFNGFIDLLFKRGEWYSVLDWKSDSLNDRDFISYNHAEDLKKHTDNSYSIQRVLYSYFLIEWLTDLYGEDREKIFNEHFGGIYYVYLRGCISDECNGIYVQTWNSYSDLKKEFDNIIYTFIGRKK